MGILDMFSPESMLKALNPESMLKAMGVEPAQMLAEYERWKAEFAGMKAAFVVLHTQQRDTIAAITALQQQNAAIVQLLLNLQPKQNGEPVNGYAERNEPIDDGIVNSGIGHG